MIDRKKFVRASSIRRALTILGDVSTLLIIGGCFLGAHRFDELLSITKLQKPILSDRLSRLCKAGLLEKRSVSPNSARQAYHFTRKGAELQRVALLLLAWEERWDVTSDSLFRVQLFHKACGQPTYAIAKCGSCKEKIATRAVEHRPGPGEGFYKAQHIRQRRPAASVAEQHARSVLPGKVNRILGDRWSALIIDALLSGNKPFDELHLDTGASTNILTERLKTLSDEEILEKTMREDGRKQSEYGLTERGWQFQTMFLAIQEWGDKWYAAPEGPPQLAIHKDCGAPIQLELECAKCGGQLNRETTDFRVVSVDPDAAQESWTFEELRRASAL